MVKTAPVSEGKKNPTLKDVYSLLQVLAGEVASLKTGMEELTLRVNHIDAELASFKESVKDRFDIVNKRFDSIDKKFDRVEARLDRLETGMTHVEQAILGQTEDIIKLKAIGTEHTAHFGEINKRISDMDQKFTLEIRELRVEIRDRVIVRIDNHEGRIYNLERRPAS